VISPWARPHYVSHVVHDHTSTLRLVEALFDLPALTGRDANADALLDMFDFTCGPHAPASAPPAAGSGSCN
jgi:phospholipase C